MAASEPDNRPGGQDAAAAPLPRLIPLENLLDALRADAAAAHQARETGQPRGPVTGFRKLDEKIGGALPVGVTIVHGGPGVGKTAWGLQVAATCGCPALFVSCEMGPLELLRRVIARTTETFLGRLKSGELAPDHTLHLARKAIAAAPKLALVDSTQAFAKPDWIAQHATRLRGDGRDVLIVVDSFHSWAGANGGDLSEYESLNEHVRALQSLAQGLQCPIIAIAERNRASMASGGVHAGAGTRKLEYGAEVMLELDTGDDPKQDAEGVIAVTLKVSKNRHGTLGAAGKLKFHGAIQRFCEG